MRHSQRCPKRQHRVFAVIPKFDIPDHDSSNLARDVPVVSVERGLSRRIHQGHFEVWICERCGLSEFYAVGLEGLAATAQQYPGDVRIVDATGKP